MPITLVIVILIAVVAVGTFRSSLTNSQHTGIADTSRSLPAWQQKLYNLCWVTYAPTNWSPEPPLKEPSLNSIRTDLQVLRAAGFNGLVTYGSTDDWNVWLPELATETGFEGLLIGLWHVPLDANEFQVAQTVATHPITIGYVVGNEGLGIRYQLSDLKAAIEEVRQVTGKPATTTEQVEDYGYADLLALGDWVFPNAHPYFVGHTDPTDAVEWTEWAYTSLAKQTSPRPLIFKEVGLPTDGDVSVNERGQAEYYHQLQQTDVYWVWFEAFDQPWKQWLPVEAHWGLFHADRSPKAVESYICGTTRE